MVRPMDPTDLMASVSRGSGERTCVLATSVNHTIKPGRREGGGGGGGELPVFADPF